MTKATFLTVAGVLQGVGLVRAAYLANKGYFNDAANALIGTMLIVCWTWVGEFALRARAGGEDADR